MFYKRFPVEYQMDSKDCGPASLKIIAKYFGKYYSLQRAQDHERIRSFIMNNSLALIFSALTFFFSP